MFPYSTRWRYCQCEPLLTVQVEFSFYSWAAQCAQSLMLNWRFSVVENNIVVSPDHEAVAMLGRLLSGKRKGQKLVNDQDSCVMNLLLPDLSSWKRFLGADSSLLFRCGFHVKCMSSRPLSVCFLFRTSGKHSQAGSTKEGVFTINPQKCIFKANLKIFQKSSFVDLWWPQVSLRTMMIVIVVIMMQVYSRLATGKFPDFPTTAAMVAKVFENLILNSAKI